MNIGAAEGDLLFFFAFGAICFAAIGYIYFRSSVRKFLDRSHVRPTHWGFYHEDLQHCDPSMEKIELKKPVTHYVHYPK